MTDTIIDHSKYIHIQDSHLILSWKVWITFVIVRISCVESWLSNSYISLTAIQLGLFSSWLKQFMVTWVQPWHQGSLSILYILFTSPTCWGFTPFTFGKCLPIQFSGMIRIWFFAFVECPPLRFWWYEEGAWNWMFSPWTHPESNRKEGVPAVPFNENAVSR